MKEQIKINKIRLGLVSVLYLYLINLGNYKTEGASRSYFT
jgi:hypothetical protein